MSVDSRPPGTEPPVTRTRLGQGSRRRRVANRAGEHRHLLAGSVALVIGAAVQAATGAAFWLVAARIDTTDDVGKATALFTSILFIAYLSGLGLQVALARFAPDTDDESHRMFAWGILATTLWSALVASIYLLVVDTEATRALTGWHPVAGPVFFVATAAGSSLTFIIDVRWMTVRRWGLVLLRISAVGLLRFPILPLPTGGSETFHLFVAASLPLTLSGFVSFALMSRVTHGRHRLRPLPIERAAAARYSAVNYLSTLAYQAPQFVLPVIVLLSVDPDRNAAFYVAWGITAIAMFVPMAIGQALLAEGGKDGAELQKQVRVILVLTVTLISIAALATFVGRDIVTMVYGDDYIEAATVLPALVAACIPWAITSVFLTEARVLRRTVPTVSITGSLTIAILIPALILIPDDGLDGATVAFVFGNIVAAIVATGFHFAGRASAPTLVPADAGDDALALP